MNEQQAEQELIQLAKNIPIHDFETFKSSILKGQKFNHYDMSDNKKTLIEDIAIEDSYLNFEGWELVYGNVFRSCPIIIDKRVEIYELI